MRSADIQCYFLTLTLLLLFYLKDYVVWEIMYYKYYCRFNKSYVSMSIYIKTKSSPTFQLTYQLSWKKMIFKFAPHAECEWFIHDTTDPKMTSHSVTSSTRCHQLHCLMAVTLIDEYINFIDHHPHPQKQISRKISKLRNSHWQNCN